jgi:hypothetical protein
MLSLTNCREILGADSANISDAEMEAIRDQLYYLASVTVNTLQSNRGRSNAFSNLRLSLNQCLADRCIEVEEIAAVMEFDGRLSRDEAERAAIAGAVKNWNN